MRKPASGWLTLGHKTHWSKYSDSHQVIADEHKLVVEGAGRVNAVPFEIIPPNDDLSQPLDKWEYRVDDGMTGQLPEWYDKAEAEKAARAMLKEWAAQKLIRDDRELKDGEFYVLAGVTVTDNSGTVTRNYGTVIVFVSCAKTGMTSASAVLVDRSVNPPVCYVGIQAKESK